MRTEPSTLVLTLQTLSWVPQKDGGFVRPAEASQDLLPEGFAFDPGWPWIKEVGFGEESAKRVEQHRRVQEIAKELGFDDDEALDHAKRFAELDPDTRRRILAENEAPTVLPDHQPGNPARRAERVRREAENAPGRDTEIRNRSVSKHRDEAKEKAKPYLRDQYTNNDGVMICQVCMEKLPFKLDDGNYYFESVEFLAEIKKHYSQNYLALCPNHAAMYQYANGSKKKMKELFLGLNGNKLEVVLADEEATIYFTRTHITDLRVVIETDDSNQPET